MKLAKIFLSSWVRLYIQQRKTHTLLCHQMPQKHDYTHSHLAYAGYSRALYQLIHLLQHSYTKAKSHYMTSLS